MRVRIRSTASFFGLFLMLTLPALALDPAKALQDALGTSGPIYKASATELKEAVRHCAAMDPAHAGVYVRLVVESGRNDADALAPWLVNAAIRGLGTHPAPERIAGIVSAAIKAAPSEVLDIVKAAVKASPRSAAPAIVTAATSSVPHPEQMVTANTLSRGELAHPGDKDGKDYKDYKQTGEPKRMTLAEAIVQAALQADPGLSYDVLMAAADLGLTRTFASNRPLTGVLAPAPPPTISAQPPSFGSSNQPVSP